MLENILTTQDCEICKICCKFEPDELIDAPTFTVEQMEYSKKINNRAKFTAIGNIYQINLERWKEKYIGPFLIETGCQLGDMRPFDCKSWPFYLMKKQGNYIIALSQDCPVVLKKYLDYRTIDIHPEFISICYEVISKYPEMIMDYNREMPILYVFN